MDLGAPFHSYFAIVGYSCSCISSGVYEQCSVCAYGGAIETTMVWCINKGHPKDYLYLFFQFKGHYSDLMLHFHKVGDRFKKNVQNGSIRGKDILTLKG